MEKYHNIYTELLYCIISKLQPKWRHISVEFYKFYVYNDGPWMDCSSELKQDLSKCSTVSDGFLVLLCEPDHLDQFNKSRIFWLQNGSLQFKCQKERKGARTRQKSEKKKQSELKVSLFSFSLPFRFLSGSLEWPAQDRSLIKRQ